MTKSMIQLQEEDILLDLEAKNKDGVLLEMLAALHKHSPHLKIKSVYQILRERELIGSTGVGNGVAIPHGKVEGLDRLLVGFGRSRNGISYDAIDNQPVHLLVMIISPADVLDEYLKTLAGISRLLKQPEKRKALRTTENPREVIDIFQKATP